MLGKIFECKTWLFCQSKLAKCKHQTIFATKSQTFKINSNHRIVHFASGGFLFAVFVQELPYQFAKVACLCKTNCPPRKHTLQKTFCSYEAICPIFNGSSKSTLPSARLFLAIFQGFTQPKPRAILLVFFCASPLPICQSMFCQIANFFCKTAKLFVNLF